MSRSDMETVVKSIRFKHWLILPPLLSSSPLLFSSLLSQQRGRGVFSQSLSLSLSLSLYLSLLPPSLLIPVSLLSSTSLFLSCSLHLFSLFSHTSSSLLFYF